MKKYYIGEKNIKNYTPHDVVLYDFGKPVISFPSCGVARCQTTREKVSEIVLISGTTESDIRLCTIDINSTQFGQVEGLPEPDGETFYIVSLAVAQAMSGKRSDLLVTDDTVRDENGKIVGCRAFARV